MALRALYRGGGNLNESATGLCDLFAGRDTPEAEAAAMVVGEALAIYIRRETRG